MFRFIHTADIHLDSPLKGLEAHEDAPVNELRGATRRAFDNLIELAIEEEVAFVLIAGDLYDGDWKDYNTGLFFAGRMGRLEKAGIKVFIVSGNHDAASNTTKTMPLPANVTIFTYKGPESIKVGDIDVVIHGQSYSKKAITDNLAAGYPHYKTGYFNIGLLHTSLTGRENHENYAPCNLDDLVSKGYDYWALGHVHKREVVSEDPIIIFPGNIQARHIKEIGSKGATLVTVEDGRITDLEMRELDVLQWVICDVDLSGCETTESVYDSVRLAFEQERDKVDSKVLALRLILTGQCPIHAHLLNRTFQLTDEFRAIAESIGDIWLEKVKFRTTRKVNLEEFIGEDTPIAGLIKSIQRLELESEDLTLLVPELATLKAKLPVEVQSGDDPFLDNSPETRAELCAEVQEILISKLLQHGEE
jgi:DNA repair protein SbcD/Mre11